MCLYFTLVIENCDRVNASGFSCLTPEFGSDVGYPEKFAGNNSLLFSFDGLTYHREPSLNVTITKPSTCSHIAGDTFDPISLSSSSINGVLLSETLFKHGWLKIEGGDISDLCALRSALIGLLSPSALAPAQY